MSNLKSMVAGRLYRVSDEAISDPDSILIISSEFPPGPGGIGKHAFDLARAMSWRGYNVTVFSPQDHSTEREVRNFKETLPTGIKHNRFSREGSFIHWRRWKMISNFLRHKKPGRIIVTGRFPLWLGWLIKRRYRDSIPVHAFIHGSELGNSSRLNYIFTSMSLAAMDHLWAVSNYTRNLLRERTKRNDVRVLTNGLWLNDWPATKDFHSQNWAGNPALLTVGRISSRKGQHLLVRALPVISKYFTDVHYHLVGIPEGKEKLELIAQKLNVDKKITYHGKVPGIKELASCYYACSVFIMLSETQRNGETEGFGIAILEANFCGKPALGARGSGIEDAIMDGYNGRLVDGDNPEQIADALRDIMDNYAAYSARAKKWAVRHDWKILIDQFISVEDVPLLTNINYEA